MLDTLSNFPVARDRPRAIPRGFTLPELAITLVIVGVLAAVAVPSMMTFIARKRVDSIANDVMTALRLARSLPLQINNYTSFRVEHSSNFTCYSVTAAGVSCSCTNWPKPTCSESTSEKVGHDFKTVIVQRVDGVTVGPDKAKLNYKYDNALPANGDEIVVNIESSGSGGHLRVMTNPTGLPRICSVSGHPAYPACPSASL